MPKAPNKKNIRKRRTSPTNSRLSRSVNSENHRNSNQPRPTQRKRLKPEDEIAKSKQLTSKLKKACTTRLSSNKNNKTRLCANGKPMPSLAELEQMYEDSDNDGEQIKADTISTNSERCRSLVQEPLAISEDKCMSPKTLKEIARKVIDIVSNLPTVKLNNEPPPPPVVPQKKRKKNDIPYIVGCKDRPQVLWKPKCRFGQGIDDYGINETNNNSSDDEDSHPKKRRKRSAKINISKSIFNAKSDEIAAKLKESEREGSLDRGSPDSNKTIGYDYSNISPSEHTLRSFSPLPSTSTNMDVFLQNDHRLNESLLSESIIDTDTQNDTQSDVEVIEIPCESVIIDDTTLNRRPVQEHRISCNDDSCIIIDSHKEIKKRDDNSPIKVDSLPCESVIIDDTTLDRKPVQERRISCNDDSCIIIESDKERGVDSPIQIDSPLDDVYASVDLTQNYDNDICKDIDIDVDEIIAENKAVLEKFNTENTLDMVICVEPSTSFKDQHSDQNRHNNVNTSVVVPNTSVSIPSPDIIEVSYTPGTGVRQNSHIRRNKIADAVTNFFNNTINLQRGSNLINDLDSQPIIDSPRMSLLSENLNFENETILMHSILNAMTENISHPQNSSDVNFPRSRQSPMRNICDLPSNLIVTKVTRVPANKSKSSNKCPDKTTENNFITSEEQQQNKNGCSLGDCPICMESLANSTVASTLCGHVFCMSCIKAAFRANGKKCPKCRKALKGTGYHQLFL